MKIAVINFSGNVGKSTVSNHLLSSRMPGAPIIAVETINETSVATGISIEKVRGDQFRMIFKRLVELDDAIIDVGASNVEDFLEGMTKFEDSHLEVDLFIVPTTSGNKELRDTINLINALTEFGVPASKIKVICNRVNRDATEEFAPLFAHAGKSGKFQINPDASIFENELFDMLASRKLTVAGLLADSNDYKPMAKAAPDEKTKHYYLDMYTMRSFAKTVNANLNKVFEAITA